MHISSPKSLVLSGVAIFILWAAAVFSMQAQDLLARKAPVDRRQLVIDSVTLENLLEDAINYEGLELYQDKWDTYWAHVYPAEMVPDSFRIDLRGFAMPTPSTRVTSNYGYRKSFRRQHKGIDVKVYTGDTIYAAFDGKVRVVRYERGGYGNFIVIRHNNGLETIYGHLSKQLVKTDQEVKAGEPIGLGGNTGRSYGSHLHFETRLCGVAINPALLFDFVNQDVTGDYYVFHKSGSSVASSSYATASGNSGGSVKYYRVKSGDNLSAIAKRLGTSVNRLCSQNGISTRTTLRIGQILKY